MTSATTSGPDVGVMDTTVLRHALRRRRRAIIGTSVGFIALALMTLPLYSSMESTLDGYTENLPDAFIDAFGMGQLSTPEGFVNAEVFLLAPFILGGIAASWGARALAGREEDGTLGTILGLPLPRRTLAITEIGAILVGTTMISVALLLGMAIGNAIGGLDIGLAELVAATVMQLALVLAAAGTALLAGVITGRRSVGFLTGLGLLIVSYVIDTVSRLVSSLDWVKYLSVQYWFNGSDPLSNGIDPAGLLILGAIAVVTLALGVRLFEQRDLAI